MKNQLTKIVLRQSVLLFVITVLFSFTAFAQRANVIGSNPVGGRVAIIIPELELVLTPNDAICYDDLNGEIIASWTGGTAPFKIRIDNGPWIENVTSPYTFDGLGAGIYTIDLEDVNGLEDSGQAEVEQPDYVPIDLVCGQAMTVGPCVADLEAEFNDWLSSFSVSGGTGMIQLTYTVGGVQVDLANLVAPDACGGSITVVAYAIDECEVTATCSGTFTVLAPDPVSLDAPADYVTDACLSQEDVDAAFEDWLDQVSYSGGCGTVLTVDPENPTAPDLCGGSITLTYTITSLCEPPVTSIATFTVPLAPAVDLDVPEDYLGTECMSQDDVNDAFADWLAEATYSGGCGAVLTTTPANPTAPDKCGGSITVIWTVTSDCEEPVTASAIFTIPSAPAVDLDVPGNYLGTECMSQDDVNDAFADWLAEATYSGGCGAVLTTTPATPTAPDKCGGSITVTWTVTSDCEEPVTASAIFTIPSAPAVDLDVPGNYLGTECMSQDDVNDAFADWLAEATYSGGCGAVLTTTPVTPTAPDKCGGSITVTWTVTSDCEDPVTASAIFTIPSAPAVDLDVPGNYLGTECMSQDDVNDAFADWLAEATYSGGCGAVLTTTPATPTAPDKCGGSITVTWTVTSNCEEPVTASATFTIPSAPPVVLTLPANYIATTCMSQADIDVAFAAWLASASVSGGCNLMVASSVDGFPSACGSVITLTLSASSDCEADVSASATFTVPVPDAILAICPAPVVMPPCATMDEIMDAYNAWKDGFCYTGDCFISDNMDDFPEMDIDILLGGTITFTYMVTGLCSDDYCTSTFTVQPCGDDGCTLTPGYWMTHSEFGPAPYDPTWAMLPNGASTIFFLSGKTYYQVLWTPPAGNAYYNLSFHYIAAGLNFLNGADPTAAQSAFDAATILFNTYTPAQIGKLKGNNAIRQLFLSLASTLDAYNNGLIGPGHCDGNKSLEVANGSDKPVEGINIFPNPVSGHGTIEFTSTETTRTVIELYSLVGQRLGVLFDEIASEGMTYQVAFDANPYQKGMYIVTIKTENSVQNRKVLISN